MDRNTLATKISEAKGELTEAEAKLETVIGALRSQPRAEKTSIEPPLEEAFLKLRAAREKLAELELLIAKP
jgi:hypothetical protein